MSSRGRLPRTVVALGLVSLLNDASAEMIVPLLPAYVVALGGSMATLGLIEGIADATAGLFRLISGALADRAKRKKPLIVAGYVLSSGVRPLVRFAMLPWHVLVVRFIDRVGKGMRGSPRDALVADVTPPADRGRAFGLHRAMDHAGNVVGPLVAWMLLRHLGSGSAGAADGGNGQTPDLALLRTLFAWAAVPAGLALLTVAFVVKEPMRAPTRELAPGTAAPPPRGLLSIRPPAVPALRRFLAANALFGLGGSSDAFLLARAMELGVPLAQLPLFPAVLSIVRVALTTPLGALSDRMARRTLITIGWVLYALVYAGFALATEPWHAWALITAYGVHYSLVEGAERALVAELAPAAERGRAFGAYHFVTAIVALPASWLFGWVMQARGAPTAFLLGAALAAAGVVLLRAGVRPPVPPALPTLPPARSV